MASKQQQSHSSLSLSLKQKLKFICCNFCEEDDDDEIEVQKVLEHSSTSNNNASSLSSLISWLKSEFPELKNFFNGKHHHHLHQLRRNRRVNSSEFRYDPLSYALNFEDDDSHLDEFPLRNFSARLPPSPVKDSQNAVVF